MNKIKKKNIYSIIAIVAIILIAIVVVTSTNTTPRAADELVINAYEHTGEPEGGFDPLKGWGCGHVNFEPLIQSTLFKTAKNGSLVNDLATNYTISEDRKTWTVNIRDDVKFSDGKKLTAKDVAFTFNTAVGSNSELDMSNLDKASAVNDTTVQFKLKEPQSSFIWRLRYVGIVPEHAYKKETYGSKPIGSGPYKLVQWNKGQQVIFELNPYYYGKKPYFKKITMLFLDKDAAFAALKSGKIDACEVDLTYVNQSIKGYKLQSLPASRARGLSFPMENNTGKKGKKGEIIGNNVTSDIAIRKALNVGINRKSIVSNILYGKGQEEYTGVDQREFGNPDAKIKDNDKEQAKKILEDAGWKDTDGDGIREKNGTKAEFDLYYSSEDSERQALSVEVSEQAKELGIKINLIGTNWDKIYSKQYCSAVLYAYSSIDTFNLYQQYHSKEADDTYKNPGLYNNSIVDNYLENGLKAASPEEAKLYWQKAAYDGQVGFGPAGDATWLWLVTTNYNHFIDETIDTGTPPSNSGADFLINIYDWKRVEKNK